MANVTLGGAACETFGELPEVGTEAPNFMLRNVDLSFCTMKNFEGKNLILNIFPSIDTGTCAASVREFNKRAAGLENTVVLCVSRDLPFAQKRFCGAEGIENVSTASDFATGDFGKSYGIELTDGAFKDIHARAIVVVDQSGIVLHTELVSEIGHEPNYDAAIAVLFN